MASTSTPVNPDSPVSVKINFNGGIRRTTLQMRDLGMNIIETKIRSALDLSDDAKFVIERFSDSASNFVVLDNSNAAVYKQLLRAAKAKSKLKFRVTMPQAATESAPRAATVEDEPELEAKSTVEHVEVADAPSATAARTPANLPPPIAVGSSIPIMQRPRSNPSITKTKSSDPSLTARTRAAQAEANNVPVTRGPTMTTRFNTPLVLRPSLAVCCNSCDRQIPDVHHHCSICDDGDFDLCQDCIDKGATCHGSDHWLIKRFVNNNKLVTSITEKPVPKIKIKIPVTQPKQQHATPAAVQPPFVELVGIRTCNQCIRELPDTEFVHCISCADYDLCQACFGKGRHGHDPRHGFVPAIRDAILPYDINLRMAPGRNAKHWAICDGCEKYIYGIRHKCIDCPDWDYCGDCHLEADIAHPHHRFVPVYDQSYRLRQSSSNLVTHHGIVCDGPLCKSKKEYSPYISGIRYKCAVCPDTDFCANCEASPANSHNQTHPLIKMKTPIRRVSVSTHGEHANGTKMPMMGDVKLPVRSAAATREASTNPLSIPIPPPSPPPAWTPLLMKTEETSVPGLVAREIMNFPVLAQAKATPDNLVAVYMHDTVADGTHMPADHIFQQTWVLRNGGTTPWPAGCSVRYVGGDYMGYVDSKRPAGVQELVSASESTICRNALQPGQEFAFTVLLRTPAREGRVISYWRLTTPVGFKFGHRLWCDVSVQPSVPVPFKAVCPAARPTPEEVEAPVAPVSEAVAKTEEKTVKKSGEMSEEKSEDVSSSQMVFPKLEKESPVSSVYKEATEAETVPEHEETSTLASSMSQEEFEGRDEDAEWEASQDDFMTDEEYDILDASDEEQQ